MARVLCVDFGSTTTKAVLVETDDGALIGTSSAPTTATTDVLDGYRRARKAVGRERIDDVLACSSAGGGLRLAVVGHQREVTAEAGRRVGLTSGARVVHLAAGPLDAAGMAALAGARPDLVLLTGGTDGGNADVVLHNARALAGGPDLPVVVAANKAAAQEISRELQGRRHTIVGNVVPRIGDLEPAAARAAIRQAFLSHVIADKGLSGQAAFRDMVRCATPDAVLAGVEALASVVGEVLAVDVGGATTDVYSVLLPSGEDAQLRRDVVGTAWAARTVEGDLGLRWNATAILAAADREGWQPDSRLQRHAERMESDPLRRPETAQEAADDRALAGLAALIAVRRHARPDRPLGQVRLIVGSGGVLRHGGPAAPAIPTAVGEDWAGGWRVPDRAAATVDRDYRLGAAGLVALTDAAAGARIVAPLAQADADRPRRHTGTGGDDNAREAQPW